MGLHNLLAFVAFPQEVLVLLPVPRVERDARSADLDGAQEVDVLEVQVQYLGAEPVAVLPSAS